jgi:hypothetical protein
MKMTTVRTNGRRRTGWVFVVGFGFDDKCHTGKFLFETFLVSLGITDRVNIARIDTTAAAAATGRHRSRRGTTTIDRPDQINRRIVGHLVKIVGWIRS